MGRCCKLKFAYICFYSCWALFPTRSVIMATHLYIQYVSGSLSLVQGFVALLGVVCQSAVGETAEV